MELDESSVSVIIPIYNGSKYLKECIDSVISQTYKNLEIILVDDGSSDASGDICDDYFTVDNRIKVIHKKNEGVSVARNKGIEASSGEYIMFVDADDELASNCIEVLIHALKRYESDIVCAECFHNVAEKEELCAEVDGSKIDVCEQLEFLKRVLCYHPNTFAVWAKLYRKSIIGETRFSPEIKINEDLLFLFEVSCKKPKVLSIKDKVYYYRENQTSVSRSKYSDKFEDILLVAERKYLFVKDNYPELIYLADNTLLKAKMNLLKILCVRTCGEKKELEAELIRYIKKNYKLHISTTKHDDRWLKIIRYNLYYVYKFVYHYLRKKR